MNIVTNSIALFICQLLDWTLNIIIFGLAVVELVIFFWRSLNRLSVMKGKVDELTNERRQTFLERLRPHSYKKTSTETKEWDYEKFDELRKEYEGTQKIYSTFSLVIQLFPLLGILGTVAGLFISINNGTDIYEGVKFALSSTVYGIIFAVLFKVLDIFLITWFVDPIDYNMERFEKNYQEYKENYNTGFGANVIKSEKTGNPERKEQIKYTAEAGKLEKKEEIYGGNKSDAAAGRTVRSTVHSDADGSRDPGEAGGNGGKASAGGDRDKGGAAGDLGEAFGGGRPAEKL